MIKLRIYSPILKYLLVSPEWFGVIIKFTLRLKILLDLCFVFMLRYQLRFSVFIQIVSGFLFIYYFFLSVKDLKISKLLVIDTIIIIYMQMTTTCKNLGRTVKLESFFFLYFISVNANGKKLNCRTEQCDIQD